MANKQNKRPKRPKHTRLVMPGEGKKAKEEGTGQKPAQDRLGRVFAGDAQAYSAPEDALRQEHIPAHGPPAGGAEKADIPRQNSSGTAPPKADAASGDGRINTETGKAPPVRKKNNIIRFARHRRLTPARRRRRRRRARALLLLAVAALGIALYNSGFYLTAATLAGDMWEGLRLAARPGEGFPMNMAVLGFIKAEPMGENGFVALGDREVVLISDTGKELERVQHAYLQPGVSAGDTRVVVYGRGGREYTVYSRGGRVLANESTAMDIQFAEMSPGGWLAVAAASRFTAEVTVYDPTYSTDEPLFVWRRDDEKPILAAFHSDNRTLLLGCVSAKGGELGSTLLVMRTNRRQPLAQIRVDGAQLLKASFLSNGRIMAVFSSFAAVYSQNGEELARYGYGQRSLHAADIYGGSLALVLGAFGQEQIHTVLLNAQLQPVFEAGAEMGAGGLPRVLADEAGVFLLLGQQVIAYNLEGAPMGEYLTEEKTYTLVHGGQPLLLAAGLVKPLAPLVQPNSGAQPGSGTFGGRASSLGDAV